MAAPPPSGAVALVGDGEAGLALAALCLRAGRPLRLCGVGAAAAARRLAGAAHREAGDKGAAGPAGAAPEAGAAPAAGAASVAAGAGDAADDDGGIRRACADAEIVIMAPPSRGLRPAALAYGAVAQPEQVVLLACRGVEADFTLPEQVLRQVTCVRKVGVFGGPPPRLGGAAAWPAAMVVAARFAECAAALQQLVRPWAAAVHHSRDLIGVQVATAMACVTSMAQGMAEATGLDDVARNVLRTRGFGEAARLGLALGARLETFTGLAGVGALLPVPGADDVHRRLGAQLARGAAAEADLAAADGPQTVLAARQVAAARGLPLPLLDAVAAVLHGTEAPQAALHAALCHELDFGRDVMGGG